MSTLPTVDLATPPPAPAGTLQGLPRRVALTLPEEHAHQQVDEQARQAGAGRDPHRQDREQGDQGSQQQDGVELVGIERHGHLILVAGPDPIGARRSRRTTLSAGGLSGDGLV